MIPRDWVGLPAVVIASGPSLLPEDVDWCCGKAKVIVVSNNWRLAPWADVMYAADKKWWDYHADTVEFSGEKWCGMDEAANAHGLKYLRVLNQKEAPKTNESFSFNPAGVHRGGGNSGFQAVNMALLRGASTVYLLGFDMQATGGRRHWFGDHPGKLHQPSSDYAAWRNAMDTAASSLPAGVEIINCTRQTALKAYRIVRIQECLHAALAA
jgi:hypothetical protein